MTVASFVTTLAGVTVSGVTRQYVYPPNQISTADLPASFVRPPQSDYAPLSTCTDTADEITCQLVIAIEPTGQSTQPANYAAMVAMVDAINSGLRTSETGLGALVTWQVAAQDREPIIVGGSAYWGVTATVTKRG